MCLLANTGFSRWWLSLAPLSLASILGSIAFALGLCSLRSVKEELEIDPRTRVKLETFVLRMLAFSLLVLVPKLSQLAMQFYEAENTLQWERSFYEENCDDLFVPCRNVVSNEKPSAVFISGKFIVMLLPALAPLVWIANRKTLQSWGSSSRASTVTSSSCVKSNSEEKSLLDDSRHEGVHGIYHKALPPIPTELANYKV